jgi:hypothetical protein
MSPAQRQTLFDNTARQVGAAARHIQDRHIINCNMADPAYGAGVANALDIDFNPRWPPPSRSLRMIGILVVLPLPVVVPVRIVPDR